MRKVMKGIAPARGVCIGLTALAMLIAAAGCEPYDMGDEEGTYVPGENVQAAPAPAPEPVEETNTVEEAEPAPPPVAQSGFIWEPRSDSVRVVIPASLPHWQFHVFSRWAHFTLYGPDNRGGNQPVQVEYILRGGGAYWQAQSLAVDPTANGSVMVYINTLEMQDTGHASAGWRIINPTQRYEGDVGTRLQPGEHR